MSVPVDLSATAWTIIPIILTVGCVLITKRILLSMTVGIVSAAFMVANFNLFETVRTIEKTVMSIFFTGPTEVQGLEGVIEVMVHPNAEAEELFGLASRWYFSIIVFLLGLGLITSFVVITGGSRAFVESVSKRVKTRRGVQFMTVIIGFILIIDDYFSAMVTGNIGKTLSEKHRISRAKITYNVDSTSAPICIIAPVSSWAVAIMGNIALVYEKIGHEGNVFLDFLRMIPYHFYVMAALLLVLINVAFDFDIFAMKKYEERVRRGEDDASADDSGVGGLALAEVESCKGTVWDFWGPILSLVLVTIGTMFITGAQLSSPEDIAEYGLAYAVLDNMSLSMSLLLGGIAGGVSALYIGIRHVKAGEVTREEYRKAIIAGLNSMRTAIGILCLSWVLASVIGQLGVGTFFANMLEGIGVYGGLIPFIMFIAASLMAFSIGTSWGTFAIVLPIAGAVASAIDISLLMPAMSAVLSGAVFGDHASPISDTTVLAAAGANCKVLPHFESQLPYTIIAAILASFGYLAFGLSHSVVVGYIVFGTAVGLVAIFAWSRQKKATAAQAQ
ncbi:MAG: hypothetical protein FWD91_00685 [Treponema sp.]|nr:hypothetical protein [Treponema sp.]